MSSASPPRRLALLRAPDGGPPELAEGELHHARNVLRLQPGDLALGLDGAGAAWPLRVTAVGRRDLELTVDGEPRREPAPGTPGGRTRVEVALSLPKGGRAEEMLDRLTQLGVDRLVALVGEHTPPHARELPASRRRRLERVAREACKQSIRLWTPHLAGPVGFGELWRDDAPPTALLDPRSSRPLADWAAGAGDARELRLVVGPEGGFTDAELAAAAAAGAATCWLAPHVLRIETAAELACGIVHHARAGRDRALDADG